MILTEKFANDAKKMRYLESLFGENGIGEDVKPVAILNTEQVLTRYGMTEETFIKYATEISTTDSEDE